MRIRFAGLGVAALCSLSGCAGVPSANRAEAARPRAFLVPRDTFYPSLTLVAVEPVVVPRDLDYPEAVREQLEAAIEDELRAAAIDVVPAAEVAPLVREIALAQGGFYDPVTGELDQAKEKAIEAEVERTLEERFHPDAVLHPALWIRQAGVFGDIASWDGFTQWALLESFWHAKGWRGRLSALSLVVKLTRPGGEALYAKAGGLQLLAKLDADGEPYELPQAELFLEPKRTTAAVRRALDELVGMTPELRRLGGR